MKSKSRKIILIIAILFVVMGLIIISYPIISNIIAQKEQGDVIKEYNKEVALNIDKEEIKRELEEAKKYNDNLAGEPLHDPFVEGSGYALPNNYLSILDVKEIIGYIEIPKISIELPIYHGTSQEVLEKGVGHVQSTAFPIGGKTCHSVLIGHRGLPSSKLFTDLDQLEIGDSFYITVLDQKLQYDVYSIETVEPKDLEKIQIIEGRDIVTLITCTPYGINTHRLLVHAERSESIEFNPKENSNFVEKLMAKDKLNLKIIVFIGIILILIFIIIINIVIKRRKNIEK